jgi:hypothetical protein
LLCIIFPFIIIVVGEKERRGGRGEKAAAEGRAPADAQDG